MSEFGESSSTVFPTVGSELNAFFTEKEQGQVSVYDLGGRVVKQQAFNDDNTYLNLSGLSTGMYVYSITSDNELLGTGKFVKQNIPAQGPSARPSTTKTSNFKDTEMHEATYWAKWEHPDFYTDSTLITLEEGNNGFINFFMTASSRHPSASRYCRYCSKRR
ncbi:MAG: T9SS type A sorting domain-containing protein [Bacteroidota bacterium]|nr:T9SS type A sorting domain-containing protein [Bacteroidota bacterium]